MKRFVCFISGIGFAVCDCDGNYVRDTLEIEEASDCSEKQDWEKWLNDRKPLNGTILRKE